MKDENIRKLQEVIQLQKDQEIKYNLTKVWITMQMGFNNCKLERNIIPTLGILMESEIKSEYHLDVVSKRLYF